MSLCRSYRCFLWTNQLSNLLWHSCYTMVVIYYWCPYLCFMFASKDNYPDLGSGDSCLYAKLWRFVINQCILVWIHASIPECLGWISIYFIATLTFRIWTSTLFSVGQLIFWSLFPSIYRSKTFLDLMVPQRLFTQGSDINYGISMVV